MCNTNIRELQLYYEMADDIGMDMKCDDTDYLLQKISDYYNKIKIIERREKIDKLLDE